jgi:hypothetical protein
MAVRSSNGDMSTSASAEPATSIVRLRSIVERDGSQVRNSMSGSSAR